MEYFPAIPVGRGFTEGETDEGRRNREWTGRGSGGSPKVRGVSRRSRTELRGPTN